MRRKFSIATLAVLAVFTADIPASQAAQNVPLCFAIANNYNNCLRQHQRPHHWGGGGWGGGGWDSGYAQHEGGYGGGYGDYDDGYGHYRRARRNQRAQSQCAIWLAQMQASGCM